MASSTSTCYIISVKSIFTLYKIRIMKHDARCKNLPQIWLASVQVSSSLQDDREEEQMRASSLFQRMTCCLTVTRSHKSYTLITVLLFSHLFFSIVSSFILASYIFCLFVPFHLAHLCIQSLNNMDCLKLYVSRVFMSRNGGALCNAADDATCTLDKHTLWEWRWCMMKRKWVEDTIFTGDESSNFLFNASFTNLSLATLFTVPKADLCFTSNFAQCEISRLRCRC